MYSKEQIDKIGNTIVFLASNIEHASKTKILKLLYILDEVAISTTGIPFLNLEYKVWKFGPVTPDIYIELSSKTVLFKDYIEKQFTTDDHCFIVAKKEFCDDEFTDKEIEIMNLVVDTFRNSTAEQLIGYTHRENAPWYNAASKYLVLDMLQKEQINQSYKEIC